MHIYIYIYIYTYMFSKCSVHIHIYIYNIIYIHIYTDSSIYVPYSNSTRSALPLAIFNMVACGNQEQLSQFGIPASHTDRLLAPDDGDLQCFRPHLPAYIDCRNHGGRFFQAFQCDASVAQFARFRRKRVRNSANSSPRHFLLSAGRGGTPQASDRTRHEVRAPQSAVRYHSVPTRVHCHHM